MEWSELEQSVRQVASYLWNREATPKLIGGVQCDCVVRIEKEYWVIIEISKSTTLEKLRTDLAKFSTIRNSLFNDGIICKLYFITLKKPSNLLQESALKQNVTALSFEDFQKSYFDYPSYNYIRNTKTFGSLIDFNTGDPENNEYINVEYYDNDDKKYNIKEIASLLQKGKKIILTGNFGTGKSKCVKAIYDLLSNEESRVLYTIAINLREHWGAKRAEEIIDRHFSDLGINIEHFIKSYTNDNVIYLLDGFDEIGTQSWSSDKKKMHTIRCLSVVAIKDILHKAKGGVLITGREHYFNSDKEMLECFNLDDEDVLLLNCKDEFNTDEIYDFLEKSHLAQHITSFDIPQWLPKRPLILRLALNDTPELFISENGIDEYDFWQIFLNKLSQRESNINPLLNQDVIKKLLVKLARVVRSKPSTEGPITMQDLELAFENVTGSRPNEESDIMLHRLPGLGRIEADSPNRQFIDSYILNGLQVEDITSCVEHFTKDILDETWKNPLNIEGAIILASYIRNNDRAYENYFSFAIQASRRTNMILASDIISALILGSNINKIDFKGISIDNSHFSNIICEKRELMNLNVKKSIIEILDISNAAFIDCTFDDCIIGKVCGIPSESGMPKVFTNCVIDKFQSMNTVSRILKAKLSVPHKIFVTIIKKTFFQPGSGRKEEALLRGLGNLDKNRFTSKILSKLIDENILEKHKGDEGWIFSPNRKETKRMTQIMAELTMSKDPLWDYVEKLS